MVIISSVPLALLVIENIAHVTITWHYLRLKSTSYFVDVLKTSKTLSIVVPEGQRIQYRIQPRFHVRALYAIFLTCAFHGSGRKFGMAPYQEVFLL